MVLGWKCTKNNTENHEHNRNRIYFFSGSFSVIMCTFLNKKCSLIERSLCSHRSWNTWIENCGNSLNLCVSRTTNNVVSNPAMDYSIEHNVFESSENILLMSYLMETLAIWNTRMIVYLLIRNCLFDISLWFEQVLEKSALVKLAVKIVNSKLTQNCMLLPVWFFGNALKLVLR